MSGVKLIHLHECRKPSCRQAGLLRTGKAAALAKFRTGLASGTTAGLVRAEVGHDGGDVTWCRFENVPAYVAAQGIPIELPG
jgi:proline racemase